jgi:hypothetical protein
MLSRLVTMTLARQVDIGTDGGVSRMGKKKMSALFWWWLLLLMAMFVTVKDF